MLMPRKVAHRKHHRGRMRGNAKGGTEVTFGDYGLQALEPGWITARQIEVFASHFHQKGLNLVAMVARPWEFRTPARAATDPIPHITILRQEVDIRPGSKWDNTFSTVCCRLRRKQRRARNCEAASGGYPKTTKK